MEILTPKYNFLLLPTLRTTPDPYRIYNKTVHQRSDICIHSPITYHVTSNVVDWHLPCHNVELYLLFYNFFFSGTQENLNLEYGVTMMSQYRIDLEFNIMEISKHNFSYL